MSIASQPPDDSASRNAAFTRFFTPLTAMRQLPIPAPSSQLCRLASTSRFFSRRHGITGAMATRVGERGRELELSKALIEEEDLHDRVVWLKPLSRPAVWKLYTHAIATIDQFRAA